MTTRKTTTKSASKSVPSNLTETTAMQPNLAVATDTVSAVAPVPSAASAPGISLGFPPANANIPTPPEGTIGTLGTDYNGVQPRKAEQAALTAAIADVQKFPNYALLLAVTALPQAHVVQMLQLGQAWTSMRNKSAAWDGFSRTQEGMAWAGIRAIMERLKPAYDLATAADPSLATQLPGLTALLGAQKAIAKRAASTRRLNSKDAAEGKTPSHGKVGKARKRSAEKAALTQAGSASPTGGASVPVSSAPSSGEPVASPPPSVEAPSSKS